MKLRKGQMTYRIPKELDMVDNVAIHYQNCWYSICHTSKIEFERLLKQLSNHEAPLSGFPLYFTINRSARRLSVLPCPDKSYKLVLNYFTRRAA